jgi:regulator of protease activity HflC (stomatin/prohibitin superfamily)
LPNELLVFGIAALGLTVIATLFAAFFTVAQRTTAIVERLGKFVREAGPGLRVRLPFIDRVIGRVDLRVQQLDVMIETKTKDNVFVQLLVVVQYCVLPEKVCVAFYALDDATCQMTSCVLDVVRARVPKVTLNDLFERKNEIADIVKSELAQGMEDFGYGILKALVTDIEPEPKVKAAMNEINAAQRKRVAATEEAEADRMLRAKAAEGDAQSRVLQHRGIADQRRTVIAGLRDAVDEFQKSVPGATAKDVINLVLVTQYFDMLKEINAASRSNAIFVPHSPISLFGLAEQMLNAIIAADETVGVLAAAGSTHELRTALEESRMPQGPESHAAPNQKGNGGRLYAAGKTEG